MRQITMTVKFNISDDDFNTEDFQAGMQEIVADEGEEIIDDYPSIEHYESNIVVE